MAATSLTRRNLPTIRQQHEPFRYDGRLEQESAPSQSFGRPKARLASRNNGSGLVKAKGK
jgi:hypothetical protein